jgi:hypothetical protein
MGWRPRLLRPRLPCPLSEWSVLAGCQRRKPTASTDRAELTNGRSRMFVAQIWRYIASRRCAGLSVIGAAGGGCFASKAGLRNSGLIAARRGPRARRSGRRNAAPGRSLRSVQQRRRRAHLQSTPARHPRALPWPGPARPETQVPTGCGPISIRLTRSRRRASPCPRSATAKSPFLPSRATSRIGIDRHISGLRWSLATHRSPASAVR